MGMRDLVDLFHSALRPVAIGLHAINHPSCPCLNYLPITSPICLIAINTENTAVLDLVPVILVSSPMMVAPAPAPIPKINNIIKLN